VEGEGCLVVKDLKSPGKEVGRLVLSRGAVLRGSKVGLREEEVDGLKDVTREDFETSLGEANLFDGGKEEEVGLRRRPMRVVGNLIKW